jgi:trans-aconitate methyltransferase
MHAFLLILYAIVILFLLYALFALVRGIMLLFRKDFVPFVPIPSHVLAELIPLLKLDKKSVLYDLGCGDGKIICAAHHTYPSATCIGIEKQWGPYLWGKIKHSKQISGTCETIRGDLFGHAYKDATHITAYLFPEFMNRLLPKLEQEVRAGTKLFSIDFPFAHKEPTHVIPVHRHNIYIYEF